MASNEVDEALAMLCHMELAGGSESLTETIAALPRGEVARLLALAIVELMDAQNAAEREIQQMSRGVRERRTKD